MSVHLQGTLILCKRIITSHGILLKNDTVDAIHVILGGQALRTGIEQCNMVAHDQLLYYDRATCSLGPQSLILGWWNPHGSATICVLQ